MGIGTCLIIFSILSEGDLSYSPADLSQGRHRAFSMKPKAWSGKTNLAEKKHYFLFKREREIQCSGFSARTAAALQILSSSLTFQAHFETKNKNLPRAQQSHLESGWSIESCLCKINTEKRNGRRGGEKKHQAAVRTSCLAR